VFREESDGEAMRGETAPGAGGGQIHIEPGAPRPATILRVAGELEERGEEIVELFKDVSSSRGNFVFPIHIRREDEDVLVEVVTDEWDESTREQTLRAASILRDSDYPDAELRVLSAEPVPEEIAFFLRRAPAAVFQLGLLAEHDPQDPNVCAEAFRKTADRYWGIDLDFTPESLPLVEELLLSALRDEPDLQTMEALPLCLGCYLGETIRTHAEPQGRWTTDPEWGDEHVVELGDFVADPVGRAREFVSSGSPEDSIAFYGQYVLEELQSS
jgi:hypothetical protein